MKVLVDTREAALSPSIVEGLRKIGIDVESKYLEAGDYIIPVENGYVIERKTAINFVGDIKIGRLWSELDKIKSVENMKPLLVIVGSLSLIEKFTKWKPTQVLGVLNSVMLDWGIQTVFLPSNLWFVHYVYSLAKRSEIEDKRPAPINIKPKLESIKDMQLYLIESLPGISSVRARALLEKFRTPKRIFMASKEELMQVEGIGEITAEKIINVLNSPFE
ncbi:MAG: ERCC4 domain-containing protein [candidate division WOR-3 bacterium]